MGILDSLINFIQNVPAEHWRALGVGILGATGVSVVLEYIKRKAKMTSERLIFSLLGVLSGLAAFVDYAVHNFSQYLGVLPANWMAYMTGALTFYKLVLKPTLAKFEAWASKAKAYDQIMAPNVIPREEFAA